MHVTVSNLPSIASRSDVEKLVYSDSPAAFARFAASSTIAAEISEATTLAPRLASGSESDPEEELERLRHKYQCRVAQAEAAGLLAEGLAEAFSESESSKGKV